MLMGEGGSPDYSARFYARYAERYAEIAHAYIQSTYIRSSHPDIKSDRDLLRRLCELVPGRRGLDAGCGAGARDVYELWCAGYDVYGIDVVEENVLVSRRLHPEIADRVQTADLAEKLPFPDTSFDFVICNAVIQHIPPDRVEHVTLPELARVLRPGGVLQLMFKQGEGVLTVYDRDYGAERCFQLYREPWVLARLKELGLELVEAGADGRPGGLIYLTDPKPVDHCVLFARREKAA